MVKKRGEIKKNPNTLSKLFIYLSNKGDDCQIGILQDLYLDALQRQNHAHITTHAVYLDGQLDLHVKQTGFTQLCPVSRTTSRFTQIPGLMKPGQKHINAQSF